MRLTGRTFLAITVTFALVCLFLPAGCSAGEPEIIYIADGGHYAVGPLSACGTMDVWVNMTVLEGGPVDVYIMTMTQYENSYPDGLGAPRAVSFLNASVENVTSASIHMSQQESCQSPGGSSPEPLFVVVDNRHSPITPDDASPIGQVTVRLEVDQTGDYYDYYDYGFDGFLTLCLFVPLIIVIVIVASLFLAIRRSDRRCHPPPFPPPCPMPPAEHPAGPAPPAGLPEK